MSSYSVPLTWIVQGRAVLELLWASACACFFVMETASNRRGKKAWSKSANQPIAPGLFIIPNLPEEDLWPACLFVVQLLDCAKRHPLAIPRERRHDHFHTASGAKGLEGYRPSAAVVHPDRHTGRPDAGGLLTSDMLVRCNVPAGGVS
jgi:hypothetical protein